MDQIAFALSSVVALLTLKSLLYLIGGTVIGVIIGAIPGLSPVTALACFLSLTFSMTPGEAIVVFISVYVGANFAARSPRSLLGFLVRRRPW